MPLPRPKKSPDDGYEAVGYQEASDRYDDRAELLLAKGFVQELCKSKFFLWVKKDAEGGIEEVIQPATLFFASDIAFLDLVSRF